MRSNRDGDTFDLDREMCIRDRWKDTAAETFYGTSEGLSFFGMSEGD